ncbi:hypothetical protein K1719_038501 [Acacia pycnantha]|nr:hypothetical protein K1719_038501 [Acacia pycnantha]
MQGFLLPSFLFIKVVYRLHKEYVHETLLNYGLQYNKTTWIHNKIHHHINQFCISHSLQQVYIDDFTKIGEKMKEALQVDCIHYAPGIEIFSVHITKPAIPNSIRRNFGQLEGECIKVLIAIERQKIAEKEAETSKKIAISEAEKNANVSKILMLEKEGSRSQQEIENQMYLQRERCQAVANIYEATKEVEANKLKLALKFIEFFVEIAKRSSGDDEFLFGIFQQTNKSLMAKASVIDVPYMTARLTADYLNKSYLMKEFIIHVTGKTLELTFSPSSNASDVYAFVNGTEVVSMPSNLYIQGDNANIPLVGHDPLLYYIHNDYALQTIYRIDGGGDDKFGPLL